MWRSIAPASGRLGIGRARDSHCPFFSRRFSDVILATILATKSDMCGKKFELKIDNVRFVGHPTLLQHGFGQVQLGNVRRAGRVFRGHTPATESPGEGGEAGFLEGTAHATAPPPAERPGSLQGVLCCPSSSLVPPSGERHSPRELLVCASTRLVDTRKAFGAVRGTLWVAFCPLALLRARSGCLSRVCHPLPVPPGLPHRRGEQEWGRTAARRWPGEDSQPGFVPQWANSWVVSGGGRGALHVLRGASSSCPCLWPMLPPLLCRSPRQTPPQRGRCPP